MKNKEKWEEYEKSLLKWIEMPNKSSIEGEDLFNEIYPSLLYLARFIFTKYNNRWCFKKFNCMEKDEIVDELVTHASIQLKRSSTSRRFNKGIFGWIYVVMKNKYFTIIKKLQKEYNLFINLSYEELINFTKETEGLLNIEDYNIENTARENSMFYKIVEELILFIRNPGDFEEFIKNRSLSNYIVKKLNTNKACYHLALKKLIITKKD